MTTPEFGGCVIISSHIAIGVAHIYGGGKAVEEFPVYGNAIRKRRSTNALD
jgi:hypothetical protein